MFRFALAALCSAAAFAQTAPTNAEQPPEAVDKALRARIDEFYTLLVSSEFRKAEALVADDTKDYYYNGGKPTILKFEVLDIKYSDNFTRAVATTSCTQKVAAPGFPMSEWSLRSPSNWKLENGNWYFYVDQSINLNPVLMPSKSVPRDPSDKTVAPVIGIPKNIPTTPDFIFGKVSADKSSVALAPGDTVKITITNSAMGLVKLWLPGQLKGIEAKLDRGELNAGGKAILTLQAGKEPVGGVQYVHIDPTGESLAITVTVK